MKRYFTALLAGLSLMAGTAYADTIKIGIIGPFSGPFALQGKNFKAGIDTYIAEHGNKIGDDTIEIIYRDVPSADPAKSKSLAQELIVREKIQYIGGFFFTPDAMAVTPLLKQGNVPMVIMNAATSSITTQSPYVVRTSFTLPQVVTPLGQVVMNKGTKKIITVVSDYGPGIDAEKAFITAYQKAGGEVVSSLRMPLATNDFSPIMQRIKDSGADGAFAFLPAGPTTLGFMKAYADNGLKNANIALFAPGDLTQESDLPALGASALGMYTTFHYAISHDLPENKRFVEGAQKAIGNRQELSFTAVGAYDGMHVIYKMIEATNGKKDAQKAVDAVKGMAWISPRGPVSIDPNSRHITQNIYLREIAKDDAGQFYNKEIETFEKQGDTGLEQN
ncbi:ABC transporter substrate-binding protein [Bartonella sp. HY038]|uniref:ABC transporter substrate-binding protein n=1 Tax=Bartonella sp. HY038 TaxID=2759660 RepID=UPI0015FB33D5|nr:ABC transporter substrate-binding protein [Bartonella sp. HY038]